MAAHPESEKSFSPQNSEQYETLPDAVTKQANKWTEPWVACQPASQAAS